MIKHTHHEELNWKLKNNIWIFRDVFFCLSCVCLLFWMILIESLAVLWNDSDNFRECDFADFRVVWLDFKKVCTGFGSSFAFLTHSNCEKKSKRSKKSQVVLLWLCGFNPFFSAPTIKDNRVHCTNSRKLEEQLRPRIYNIVIDEEVLDTSQTMSIFRLRSYGELCVIYVEKKKRRRSEWAVKRRESDHAQLNVLNIKWKLALNTISIVTKDTTANSMFSRAIARVINEIEA